MMRVVQQRLKAQGFNPGPIDGINGPRTVSAVRGFQKSRGLDADGIAGPLTRNALGIPDAPRDVSAPLWTPHMIEAQRLVGVREVRGVGSNPTIMDWAEEQDLTQFTDDDIAWCMLFILHCIKTGYPDEPVPSKERCLVAKAWLNWGVEVDPSEARFGDLTIYQRGNPGSWMGHGSFWAGDTQTHILGLGGNQRNMVNVSQLGKGRLIGVRRAVSAPAWPEGEPLLALGAHGTLVSRSEA